MSTLTISLPESLSDFVQKQVTEGGYTTPEDYIQKLLTEQQIRHENEQLEKLLIDGLNSGPGEEATAEYWQNLRAELVERHKATRP